MINALRRQLEAVAHMMEGSSRYTADEVQLWRRLAACVDVQLFMRTGQVIATGVVQEKAAGFASGAKQVLEALQSKGHLTAVQRRGQDIRYRLILQPSSLA